MKKVLLTIGSISILFGIYTIIKGDSFGDQMPLFVNGIILFGCSFIDFKENNCKTLKEEK